MKFDRTHMRLYAVTDRTWLGTQTLSQQVEQALKGGATCIQLREKELSGEEMLAEATELRKLCGLYKVPFIINDRVDIAIRCNADGVHVGQEDMDADQVRKRIGDHMLLGVSVQTVEQAMRAEQSGADYLGVGAMFTTSTKADASSVSRTMLSDICGAVSIPVVAIGGISSSNIYELRETGIEGVAVVSALFAREDIEAATKELRTLVDQILSK